ncbi:MAG TPA: hypothetical protein VGH90_00025, partial [Chthoniobacteraceae bacterium]
MFIEPLEARVAPAALIALTLTGTSLKISLSSSEQITTSVDPNGVFDIAGMAGDAFTLNGHLLQTTGGSTPVAALTGHHIGAVSIVDSNAGDQDIINISGPILGSLSIGLSGASSTIVLNTPKVQGALSVKTPLGGTTIDFNNNVSTVIGGPVKLALGIGINQVFEDTPQLEVDGAFTETGGPVKAGQTIVGSNTFVAEGSSFLNVAGSLSFSSKFAPGSFSVLGPNLEVGGNLLVVTTGAVGGLPTLIVANSIYVGGNLSITSNSSESLAVGGQTVNVDGKVTLVQGGSGEIGISATNGPLNIGALVATGHGGEFVLGGVVGAGDVSGLAFAGATMIGGGMKLSNFGSVEMFAVGEIGGSVSIAGVSQVTVDSGATSANGHLAVGGTFTVSAPPPPATGKASMNTVSIGDVVVGGSLTINGNNGNGNYSLTDTAILGSTTLNLGTKVGVTNVAVTIAETFGDHQSFFANGFTANLPGSGSLVFTEVNFPPDLMVFGQATISEPAGST